MHKKQLGENLFKNLPKKTIVSEIKVETPEGEVCIQSMLSEKTIYRW